MSEFSNQNIMLEDFCLKYKHQILKTSLFYLFTIFFCGYLDVEINVLYNAFLNYTYCGLQAFVVQHYEDLSQKKFTLFILNTFLSGNIMYNLYLFLNFKMYFIYNIISCVLSFYFLSNNKILLELEHKKFTDNTSINQKMNNIVNNVKHFTPEQKQLFKEHLFLKMKEIITLKKELQDKVNKKDN